MTTVSTGTPFTGITDRIDDIMADLSAISPRTEDIEKALNRLGWAKTYVACAMVEVVL